MIETLRLKNVVIFVQTIFISQINLTSSASTAPSGQCSNHFSFLSRLFSRTISNGPFLQLCHVFSYTCVVLVFYIQILYATQFLPFHHTFYTMHFPMSCQFHSLHALSLMLVLVQHISLLQFAL